MFKPAIQNNNTIYVKIEEIKITMKAPAPG